jgi:hypothetical protein
MAANRIEQRIERLEDALRPGQRIFVAMDGEYYSDGRLVTAEYIAQLERDGWECVILRVCYETD